MDELDRPIHLDYNATTPHDPEVIEAMRPYIEEHFGNPSSSHWYGRKAHDAVETARAQVAALLNCAPGEIIFTSGGTESNNYAIRGIALARRSQSMHIITSQIEHPAVTEVCGWLQQEGFEITYLPVDEHGLVSVGDIEKTIRPETILITLMHANNEVGTIQPIEGVARLAKPRSIIFHTDAAQSARKVPTDVHALGVDLLSIAGHKLYAPKGVGALYVHEGIALEPLMQGARQEGGRRPGTENVLEVVGLGKACQIALRDLTANSDHMQRMRDRLEAGLRERVPRLRVNGHPDKRLPNTLSLSVHGVDANALLGAIEERVAASAGAACHSGQVHVSHVLRAMHVPEEWARGTLRFSTGRMTSAADRHGCCHRGRRCRAASERAHMSSRGGRMQSTIVVLGGGVGGMVAANEIRRRLPAAHRVVLVEKNAQHAFAPSFLWLMTGDREPDQIRRPLAGLLRRGVELVQAEVIGIDPVHGKVRTSATEIAYDHLIVALGADLAPEAIPGLAASHTFYTFEGAAALRHALTTFSGGRIAVVVSAMPYKCPGAPHEGAMLIADSFRRRGLSAKVKIHLFTPEPQPMPVAGPQLGEAVRGMLESKGIEFHPLHKLTAVEPGARELTFDNSQQFRYDLLVAVPPHRAPKAVVEAGLTNQAGWIPVDPHTLGTNQNGVYAIGDVTAIPIPGRWKPDVPLMLPKAGVFAHAQAEVVAQRIVAEVTGRPCQAMFCGDGYCMLEAGEDLAGFAFGNFFAEPAPNVQLRQIGKSWHVGKVLFEKWWLAPVGFRRSLIGWVVKAGGRIYGIPITL